MRFGCSSKAKEKAEIIKKERERERKVKKEMNVLGNSILKLTSLRGSPSGSFQQEYLYVSFPLSAISKGHAS